MKTTANEQHFQSVYLDLGAKDWKKRIVFHDPVYEQETPGVVALKSLRLEETFGFVVSAPKETLKQYRDRVKAMDKDLELGKQDPEKILSKLLETAKSMGMTLNYVQSGKEGAPAKETALDDKAIAHINRLYVSKKALAIPDLSDTAWTPSKVQDKLVRVLELINKVFPADKFLHQTAEKEDDVPIVRVLTGPRDPYTAERIGSLAFFSTQRGMEWYTKQFGSTDFRPHEGWVFVTYFDDAKMLEEPVGKLNLNDSDEHWSDYLCGLFNLTEKLPCGCLKTCPCGCATLANCPCSPLAKASVVTAGVAMTAKRPDPQVTRQILNHNCVWIGHDSGRTLAMQPIAQTKKFLIYRAGATATATASTDIDKRLRRLKARQEGRPYNYADLFERELADLDDPDFLPAVREARARLRSLGLSSRLVLDKIVAGQNGYSVSLVLDGKLPEQVITTAGFTSIRPDFHETELNDRAKLSIASLDGSTRVFLSYETGLSPSKVSEAAVVRHYFRSLKGALRKPRAPH
jgi:hypothetical protein